MASALGLVPIVVLWTLVCLGLGAWTMNAVRRLRPRHVQPPAAPEAAAESGHNDAYDAALVEVLEDGMIGPEEQARLYFLRKAWGLSPADHVHAVARVREDEDAL